MDDAEAQYLAFFASKTIGMIRAPDSFVYPAPFNLFEVFFISPFELIPFFRLSLPKFTTLNRFAMAVVFFIPLTIIAFYESVRTDTNKQKWVKRWLSANDQGEQDDPAYRDPQMDEDESASGRVISKVPFEEIVKGFPNTNQSSEALLLKEMLELKKQLALVLEKLEGGSTNGGNAAKTEN